MGAGASAATAAVSKATAADLAECVSALSSDAKEKLTRALEVDEVLGKYQKDSHVEYFSNSHHVWVPAAVMAVDVDGRIMLNVKPKVWLDLDTQEAKVRPRSKPTASALVDNGGELVLDEAIGKYQKDALVEYYSNRHQEWLSAVVIAVDADGRIMLNVKPRVWLELESQAAKVRPRRALLESKPAASGSVDDSSGDAALMHAKMKICVQKLSGEESALEVSARATFAELKQRIYETLSFPSACSFTLVLDGQPLDTLHGAGASLEDCGIQDGSSLTLITAEATSPKDRMDLALSKHGYALVKSLTDGFNSTLLCAKLSGENVGSRVAVKRFEMRGMNHRDALQENMRWAQVRHPYILRCVCFVENSVLFIAFDYCEGGTLSQRIRKVKSLRKALGEEQILRWFTQALLALKHIHEQRILHRDLKPSNFFLSSSFTLKLRGVCEPVKSECAIHAAGTPYYSFSPEIITGKPYTWTCDMWSMGCVLFEMCALKVPFDGPDLKSLVNTIAASKTPPQIPSEYSDDLMKLCMDLLTHDPKDRLPAIEALKRPLIQERVKRLLEAADKSGKKGGMALDTLEVNETVEYYSNSHKEWILAFVTDVDAEGRVMLNIKPKVWLGSESQATKLR